MREENECLKKTINALMRASPNDSQSKVRNVITTSNFRPSLTVRDSQKEHINIDTPVVERTP